MLPQRITSPPLTKADVIRYLTVCCERESPPRVDELAVLWSTTRENLTRRFTADYGVPLSVFLKEQQIARAISLLRDSALSTTAIAYRCAFGTRRTFFRAFRRHTGITPDQFRRTIADGLSS